MANINLGQRTDLVLATEHPEYGPRIREHRIAPPAERSVAHRLAIVRRKIDEMEGGLGLLRYRARLEAAADGDMKMLMELEAMFFTEDENMRLGVWPPDHQFLALEEGVALKEFLVETYRPDLRGFHIAVVFQESIPPVLRRGRLGTATKVSSKIQFLAGVHAIITLDFDHWRDLSDTDRQRLVHHELCHLALNDDRDGLRLVPHDFEDFHAIYQIYGVESETGAMDNGLLERLLEAAQPQLDMLHPPPLAASA